MNIFKSIKQFFYLNFCGGKKLRNLELEYKINELEKKSNECIDVLVSFQGKLDTLEYNLIEYMKFKLSGRDIAIDELGKKLAILENNNGHMEIINTKIKELLKNCNESNSFYIENNKKIREINEKLSEVNKYEVRSKLISEKIENIYNDHYAKFQLASRNNAIDAIGQKLSILEDSIRDIRSKIIN